MLLREMIRFSTQHRALYCYMILSIWIFLLIAGMYKYIGYTTVSFSKYEHSSGIAENIESMDDESRRIREYKQYCTPLESLTRREDGGILEGWKLQGVLMVIRHGDRGPLAYLRTIGQINCGITGNALINKYRSFLYNSTSPSGSNHMYWNKVGPFHGFPLLPATDKACLLGQLTYKGIAQFLQIGDILHQIYAHPLGLLIRQPSNKSPVGSTPHSLLNSDEVVVFSTRYRRTFQSALALLYTLLPPDKWLALNVHESHSMAFCFTDCACSQAEELRKQLYQLKVKHVTDHTNVFNILQWVGNTLLQHTPNGITDPNEVMDALLIVLCHDTPLPCRRSTINSTILPTTESNDIEQGDVINIDQDDNNGNTFNGNINIGTAEPAYILDETKLGNKVGVSVGCIEKMHVSALVAYVNWSSAREANHVFYKRAGLMRAYGLIRHIVSYMLKMISGDRTKFVLYSGHDRTLQYLTAALGIDTVYTFIPYAARLAFEVYKSEAHTDYYFRVVYNGLDVTQQIDFCEGGKSLRVTRDSRGNKADLCPIENIIRFLHEDYFSPLDATNFKDACGFTPKDNPI